MRSRFVKDAFFVAMLIIVVTGWVFLLWSGTKASDQRTQLINQLRAQTAVSNENAGVANENAANSNAYIRELDLRLAAVVRFVAEHPGKQLPASLLTLIPAPKLLPLASPRVEARARSKSHHGKGHSK